MDTSLLFDLAQVVAIIILTVIGWGVKDIKNQMARMNERIESLRREIKLELREYMRQETCKAHRESIQQQINGLKTVHGATMTSQGLALVDINNAQQMHALHEMLTPEQRRAHVESCQFREDMEDK